MPEGASWTRPDGGYFLWLTLPAKLDTVELGQRASASGVSFVPGAGFFGDERGHSNARLSFSYPPVEEIREGARRLARLVGDSLDAPAIAGQAGRRAAGGGTP